MTMVLKPQDLLVALKLVVFSDPYRYAHVFSSGSCSTTFDGAYWTYAGLAVDLGMSSSQVHGAVRRALAAGLLVRLDDRPVPQRRNLLEFLIHGVKYVFLPERGRLARGVPTAHAAEPLRDRIVPDGEPPPVWPDAEGEVRGIAFSPLCPAAPRAARRDHRLYELLVLVDAIRGGRARERQLASELLEERLKQDG